MKKIAPTKAEIALFEPFVGLGLERIHVPAGREAFASAAAEIKEAGIVGFDTESRPTFVTGDVSEGPHVVQFALHDKAYLFQLSQGYGIDINTQFKIIYITHKLIIHTRCQAPLLRNKFMQSNCTKWSLKFNNLEAQSALFG